MAGVKTAFGIPGGETLTLMEALHAAGLRFVLARHETGAGLMAEGLHHATGAPGLLVATVGPGVANCPNAVAQASLDRVPLVVVTGNVATTHGTSFTHQVFDQIALLRPLVKASFALRPDTAARDIALGIALATSGRPGPVHLDLPLDVAESPCAPVPTVKAPARPAPDVAAACARLAAARRPLVIVGMEALAAPVRGLVERLGAPTLSTYKALGGLPSSHPRWVGAAGLSPKADAVLLPLVQEADVVVLAGYDAIEMRSGWLEPFADDTFVIDVSVASSPPPEHRTDHRLVGDVAATLEALTRGLPTPPTPPSDAAWAGRGTATREALAEAFATPQAWGPASVIGALRDAVAPETFVTVDTGAHRILLSQMWRAERPGRLLQSTGLCTMGYAVPTAIGAALGADAPVVAVVGDGGFEMALGELATARDLGVDLSIVVIDDRSLALIEKKQRARGYANYGVDFGATGSDYVRLVEAFGGTGQRFATAAALRDWLRTPHRGVRLAHCSVDRRAYDDRF